MMLPIRPLVLLLLLSTTLLSCAADGDSAAPEASDGTHFTIVVGTNRGRIARADDNTPIGGEDGDGRVDAQEREEAVYNACLLLYRADGGINAPDAEYIPIEHVLYAPVMYRTSQGEYTSDRLSVEQTIPAGRWHVITVCNAGDLTALRGHSLAEVRDYLPSAPLYVQSDDADPATADGFLMSSAEDCYVDLTGEGGPDNVKHITTRVERLAARIDFSPGAGRWGTYTVTDGDGTRSVTGYAYAIAGAEENSTTRFILTDLRLINRYTVPPYLIKRVLALRADSPVYLGDETRNAQMEATNFVLDPHSAEKTDAGYPALKALYQYPLGDDGVATDPRNRLANLDELPDNRKSVDAGDTYYLLDYPAENTKLRTGRAEQYATGLQFAGYYVQYSDASLSTPVTATAKHYDYFIRHADPHGSANEQLIMKYGIVRNNLYRVRLSSISPQGIVIIAVAGYDYIELPPIYL